MRRPVNVLIAYPYFTPRVLATLKGYTPADYNLMVDSGAFSAFNSGKTITLDGYCEFLDRIKALPPFKAIQLDVIGDEAKTIENYREMRRSGYEVMPVFTRGSSLKLLDELYRDTDYILLGGVAKGAGNKAYVKHFLEANKGRKAHLLGFTDTDFIKHYKPTSCDTSSWIAVGMFGNLDIFKKGTARHIKTKRAEFSTMPSPEVMSALRDLGFTVAEVRWLAKKAAWVNTGKVTYESVMTGEHRGLGVFIGAVSFVLRALETERVLGTKVYLACTSETHVTTCIEARDFLYNRGVL